MKEADLLETIRTAEEHIADIAEEFFLAPADATARVFEAGAGGYLLTDPFAVQPESVAPFRRSDSAVGTALSTGQWVPVTDPSSTRPGRHLRGSFAFAAWYQVTARWGYPAVPAPVGKAAQFAAARMFAREFSPVGITGGDMPIYVARQDPDVMRLLAPFMSESLV